MDKRILKKIAAEWSKGILLACGTDTFIDAIDEGLITEEEAGYIVDESHKIARRLFKGEQLFDVDEIIKKYYEME